MPIENRNLEPGTKLIATYKKETYQPWWWPVPKERCSTSPLPTTEGSSKAPPPWARR